jgi:DNA polymerase zeta
VPQFTPHTVYELYTSQVSSETSRALEYIFGRVLMVVEMLDLSEIIARSACVHLSPTALLGPADAFLPSRLPHPDSEFARVYGVDFSDVWQRGSQFKVESLLFRIGKPESLLFLTPSKEAVRPRYSSRLLERAVTC